MGMAYLKCTLPVKENAKLAVQLLESCIAPPPGSTTLHRDITLPKPTHLKTASTSEDVSGDTITPLALFHLSEVYETGVPGSVRPDFQRALAYLKRAAMGFSHPASQYRLAKSNFIHLTHLKIFLTSMLCI
jgi:hypothetical protein